MTARNLKTKLAAACLTGATVFGMMAPMAANAATISPTPTATKTIDSNIVTVAAHRAAETAPMILGANLTTTQEVNDTMLDIFGSDYNVSANQFLYNYRVIGYASVTKDDNGNITGIDPENTILKLTNMVSPMAADLSGESTATNSDIYLGSGYSAVTSVPYQCSSLEDMVNTMTNLAAAMKNTGKTGLYGDPTVIATQYKNYVEKTRSQVEKAIEDEEVEEKTVAIISDASSTDANGNEQYIAYTKAYKQGTSINRAAEYLDSTTQNIVEKDGVTATDNGNGSYTISGTELSKADYVITVGFQGSNITKGSDAYTTLKNNYFSDESHIYAKLPETTYGVYMNSVENALGQAIMIMGVYEDQLSVGTDDAVAYFYSNFYHVKESYIAELVNNNFLENEEDSTGYFGYQKYSSSNTVSGSITAYEAFLK